MENSVLLTYLNRAYPEETFEYDDINEYIRCKGSKGTVVSFKWQDLFDGNIFPIYP